MSQKSSFSLVIPCYNEEKAIPSFLTELGVFIVSFGQNFPETKLNVKIVDNNSSDSSIELLKRQMLPEAIEVVSCSVQGYGAALKFGFSQSTSDYYGFADLDNTYPIEDLIPMLELLRLHQADMALGCRIHAKSDMDPIRRIGNLFYLGFTNLLFNSKISDSCSGMRIFRQSVKNDILELVQNDLSFSIELTAFALLKKWKLIEHPIHYRGRLGDSKLSIFFDGFKFLFVLFKVRIFG